MVNVGPRFAPQTVSACTSTLFTSCTCNIYICHRSFRYTRVKKGAKGCGWALTGVAFDCLFVYAIDLWCAVQCPLCSATYGVIATVAMLCIPRGWVGVCVRRAVGSKLVLQLCRTLCTLKPREGEVQRRAFLRDAVFERGCVRWV